MTKAFSGKIALVTGASRGIGRAAAIALTDQEGGKRQRQLSLLADVA